MAEPMNVLVLGGGGREHALAVTLAASTRVAHVFVAPGNGGTSGERARQAGISSIAVTETDTPALLRFAQEHDVGLTVVGPEVPLALGVVDAFISAGLRCFGPTQAPAQLEASKAFAKHFMAQHRIPTARFAVFTDLDRALAHLREVDYDVVVKASGLAAGKGVFVPRTPADAEAALRRLLEDHDLGVAGETVVIEERLAGTEVSVMAFSDGTTLSLMPPAQDHKRLLDGDLGPNTGGMGAVAPVPFLSEGQLREIRSSILEPVLGGLRDQRQPYVGVLYAGIMLTDEGPRVLEFNCRFGDPEAQVILPLLETDLVDVLLACIDGSLGEIEVRWRKGVAATVVAVSEGYPGAIEKGRPIAGVADAAAQPGVRVLQAGTRRTGDGRLLTSGGRVLAVTGLGQDLRQALDRAYHGLSAIRFEGMQHRTDIGAQALGATALAGTGAPVTYEDAGVDIAAGARAVDLMKASVRSTYGPEVLAGIGAFGGLFDAQALKGLEDPVLVASTDGVGTKTKIASALGRYDTIGQDLVNHCIDDILVQGAKPLFFLDYVAASVLDPDIVATVVGGCAVACREASCALLGGETAEMPGVYAAGELDLVGTIVGVVERRRIIDGSAVRAGDVVVGLASSGLHTNGFSLARKVLAGVDLGTTLPETGRPLGEALLEPHRSYLPHVRRIWGLGVDIHGLVHITGGGLYDNPPRILPPGLAIHLQRGSWPVPPVFRLIQRLGSVDDREMAHVFNMGLGMLVIVDAASSDRVVSALAGEGATVVGEVVQRGSGEAVRLM